MVTISEAFHTKAQAEAWRSRYLADYHPCGYGTRLLVRLGPDGFWHVTGHRFRSCD